MDKRILLRTALGSLVMVLIQGVYMYFEHQIFDLFYSVSIFILYWVVGYVSVYAFSKRGEKLSPPLNH